MLLENLLHNEHGKRSADFGKKENRKLNKYKRIKVELKKHRAHMEVKKLHYVEVLPHT